MVSRGIIKQGNVKNIFKNGSLRMSVIFQFLIPVFWSSKNKRVSSAYGIIDVSDDKAECIKRMTGPVKAWCVALKKNIFKIVTIHDEKEQFKKVG